MTDVRVVLDVPTLDELERAALAAQPRIADALERIATAIERGRLSSQTHLLEGWCWCGQFHLRSLSIA